jgi:hypothetical protein
MGPANLSFLWPHSNEAFARVIEGFPEAFFDMGHPSPQTLRLQREVLQRILVDLHADSGARGYGDESVGVEGDPGEDDVSGVN